MNIIKFKELHLNLRVNCPRSYECNPLPSDTDPTQDIPVKALEFTAGGLPINFKELHGVFSNLKIENMSTIEKRNTDKFDKVGELQDLSAKLNKAGVTTDFVPAKRNHIQKSLQNEHNNEK